MENVLDILGVGRVGSIRAITAMPAVSDAVSTGGDACTCGGSELGVAGTGCNGRPHHDVRPPGAS